MTRSDSGEQGAGADEPEWEAFTRRLRFRLRALERGDVIEITSTNPSDGPVRLTFTVTGSRKVRCTLGRDMLIHVRPPDDPLYVRDRSISMLELGYHRMRSGSETLESGRRGVDVLAATVVRTLREVWDFDDPSVFAVSESHATPTTTPKTVQPLPITSDGSGRRRTVDVRLTATPTTAATAADATHLLDLARDALVACGVELIDVDDTAVRFDVGGFYTKLIVSPYALRLEFCTIIAHGTPDMTLLGAVVAEHSSRWPDVSIVVAKDHVFAVRALDAVVFHPSNLLAAVTAWATFIEEGAIDIVEQLHPELTQRDDVGVEVMPTSLTALINEYAENPSGLTATEIMRRSRANTPMLRRYVRICAEHLEALESGTFSCSDGDETQQDWAQLSRRIRAFMPVLTKAIAVSAEANGWWEQAA